MSSNIIRERMTILAFYQVVYANPNGDPDMGNMPRMDILTNIGLMSAESIKAHIRSYIESRCGKREGYEILIRSQANIDEEIARTVNAAGLKPDDKAKDGKGKAGQTLSGGKSRKAAEEMCKRFYDVRTFGGVLAVGANAGQVQGPVQVAIARSCSPIEPIDATLTRKAYAQAKKGHELDMAAFADIAETMDDSKKRTMGSKQYIPYGLYMTQIQINPCDAEKTQFTEEDLQLLLDALANMFEVDASSSKMGISTVLPIIVFRHVGTDSDPVQRANQAKLGCAPLYRLINLVRVELKDGVETPRKLEDYDIAVDVSHVPAGVEIGFKDDFYGDVSYVQKGGSLPAFQEMHCI